MEQPRLEPTPIAPPLADDPLARAPRSPLAAHRGGLRWLLLSAVLALAAGTLLPAFFAPGPAPSAPASASGATPMLKVEPEDPILGPEAKATARLDAQHALSEVLSASAALAVRKPEAWSAQAWTAAQATIVDGERAYREERYPAASRLYHDAGRQLAGISASLPGILAERLKAAQTALDKGDSPAASRGFSSVLALDPAHAAAIEGLRRADAYERVQALLSQAKGYEHMNDVAQARAAYQAALALDASTSPASEGLARLQESDSNEAYDAAMSQGYEAMGNARFGEARSAFERALKLNRTAAAKQALADSIERATVARITEALATAERAESAERWDDAARALGTALGIEKDLKDVRARLDRARARAALARRIAEALQAPPADNEANLEELLAEAKRVPGPGPRLKAQLRQLGEVLRQLRDTAQ